MPGTNLTRDEAATRAALLDVTSYSIDLDLTTGDTTFASTTTIRFTLHASPAPRPSPTSSAPTVHEITLNGEPVDPPTAYADSRIALTDLAADNELGRPRRLPYSRTGEGLHRFVDPADDRVYLYSSSRCPTPAASTRRSSSPTSRRRSRSHVTAPEHWKVVSNSPTPEPERRSATARPCGTSRPPSRCRPTSPRSSPASTTRSSDTYEGKHGDDPARPLLPPVAGRAPRRRRARQAHQAGLRVLRGGLRLPLPVRQVRPALRAGVQHGRDGERRLRDAARRVPPPQPPGPRSFYEFRAEVILHEMAHMWFGDLVTMKWWDDLWLNESFAEWACYHAAVEATEFTEAWTGFTNARKNWAYRQDQLPSTHPIAADNVDLQRGRGQLRRHHLRQGRLGAQAARRLGRPRQLPRRASAPTSRTSRSPTPSSPTCWPRSRSPRAASSSRWAQEWLQTSGVNTLAPGVRARRRRQLRRRSRSARPRTADHPTLRRHRLGIGLYDRGRRAAWCAVRSLETDVEGELHRGRRAGRPAAARPAAAQRGRPRLRQDPPRRALAGHRRRRPRHARRLARPRPVLGRGLGHDPRRRDERDRLRDAGAQRHRHRDRRRSASAGSRRTPRRRSTPYSAPANRAALRATLGAGPARAARRRPSPAATTSCRSPGPTPRPRTATRRSADLEGLLDGSLVFDGPRGRHRPALDAADRPGQARPRRRRPDRRGAGARQHHLRPGARRRRARRPPDRRGQGRGVGDRDRPRRRRQRDPAQRGARLPGLRPGRGAGAVRREVPRRGRHACGRRRAPSAPRPRWSSCSRKQLASQELLDRVDAWLETSPANPAAKRYVREGRADVARALAAQAKDATPTLTHRQSTPDPARAAPASSAGSAAARRAGSRGPGVLGQHRDAAAGGRRRGRPRRTPTASRATASSTSASVRCAAHVAAGDDLEGARGRVDHDQDAARRARPASCAAGGEGAGVALGAADEDGELDAARLLGLADRLVERAALGAGERSPAATCATGLGRRRCRDRPARRCPCAGHRTTGSRRPAHRA